MHSVKYLKCYSKFNVYYHKENSPDFFLDDLAVFLLYEVTCFGSFTWKRLINQLQNGGETAGNLIELEKRDNNIYLSNLYNEDTGNIHNKFKIPMQTLFQLMQTWEKLITEEPDEIILTYKHERFELLGRGFPGQEPRVDKSLFPRIMHQTHYPAPLRDIDDSSFNALINEAYQNALHNGVTSLFFKDSGEYMICGYTKNGVRLQIIFDENNCIEDSFCIYLKKEKN